MKDKRFSLTALKMRGWTDALVRDLLGAPDATPHNWSHPGGPPLRQYLQERVLVAEQSEQWAAHTAKAERKQKAAAKATETRRATTLAYVDGLSIQIPRRPLEEVIKAACESENAHNFEKALKTHGRHIYELMTPNSNLSQVQQITVNYIMHEISPYDRALRRIHGRTGKVPAYVRLKNKVLRAIAEVYPELADECEKQIVSEAEMISASLLDFCVSP